MPAELFYISHPDVVIDASVPVPHWGLSEVGRRRAEAMLAQPWIPSIDRLITSEENKAVETGRIIAAQIGRPMERRAELGEIDRSSTGYVSAERHEDLRQALFDQPGMSADGWERAVDARARTLTALSDVLESDTTTAVVGHGGVGTILYCHLAGVDLSVRWDQPGQGHYYRVDLSSGRPTHHWRPIDQLADRS